ncbi:MAG: hypothetical protein ACJ74J_18200 [Blastocatellia bacterium]
MLTPNEMTTGKSECGYSYFYANVLKLKRRAVTAHYFDVMRIPVRRGRGFSETDTANSLPVAIINEALAKMIMGFDD